MASILNRIRGGSKRSTIRSSPHRPPAGGGPPPGFTRSQLDEMREAAATLAFSIDLYGEALRLRGLLGTLRDVVDAQALAASDERWGGNMVVGSILTMRSAVDNVQRTISAYAQDVYNQRHRLHEHEGHREKVLVAIDNLKAARSHAQPVMERLQRASSRIQNPADDDAATGLVAECRALIATLKPAVGEMRQSASDVCDHLYSGIRHQVADLNQLIIHGRTSEVEDEWP